MTAECGERVLSPEPDAKQEPEETLPAEEKGDEDDGCATEEEYAEKYGVLPDGEHEDDSSPSRWPEEPDDDVAPDPDEETDGWDDYEDDTTSDEEL